MKQKAGEAIYEVLTSSITPRQSSEGAALKPLDQWQRIQPHETQCLSREKSLVLQSVLSVAGIFLSISVSPGG